ncbi:MAG: lamin tail domain-containing protein, partial [bacterium]|nr:lamin tail domain-containing protein [bacterium]
MQTLCTILCAQATVYPDTLFFGRVRVGTHLVDTIRVQNPAAQDLLVDSVRMEGDGFGFAAAPFSGSVLVLSPQAEVRLLVRFSPVDTVEYVGEVQLSAEGGNLVVPVSGEGRREVVVINEILADPGSGEAGDANGDGTRHSSEDEFVELLNTGLRPFDLSGIQLSDAGTSEEKRFTFPPGTRIFGGERVVLFGGGSPQGVPGQVFADDGKIGGGLSNSGDAIFLIDPAGPDTLAKAAYGAEGGKNEALVREPEGTGNLVRHAFFPGNGTAFSPGRARVRATGALVVPVDTTIELGAVVIPSVWMDYSDGARKEVAENLEWSFSDTSVLRLHEGSFITTGVGECDVRVIVNGTEWGTVRFTVSAPGITDLQLSPSDTLVVVGAAHVFRVHGRYSDGGTTSIDGGTTS